MSCFGSTLFCPYPTQPNRMDYTDAEWVEHSIHIPKGTIEAAVEHILAKNFEELAKYPAWGKSLLAPYGELVQEANFEAGSGSEI